MVRLTVSGRQWTGVMIDPKGLILTTARNLGPAPIASFATAGGQTGQAWVLGRDDGRDVALLEVIAPTGTYAAVAVSTASAPPVDLDMVMMQYGSSGTTLDRRVARVVGVRQDLNTGIRYIQLQALVAAGAEGGALVDNAAGLRGIRMTEEQMTTLGLGRAGEVYVMANDALNNSVLPQLRSGVLIIISRPPPAGGEPGAPPAIPAIFSGTITLGGRPPLSETRLYARVTKAGLADIWFSAPLATTGLYVMPLGIIESGYGGAAVEFWALAKKATQTAVYQPGAGSTLNLTFP